MNQLYNVVMDNLAIGVVSSTRFSILLLGVWFLCVTNNAFSHEFWMEPVVEESTLESSLKVHLLNGQHFSGESIPYIRDSIKRFTLITAKERTSVIASTGDMPVVMNNLMHEGLHILQYESVAYQLVHANIEQFEQYTVEEGVQDVLKVWQQSNNHVGPVHESYRRFAKSLISRGAVSGSDGFSGMLLELVALDNPFEKSADSPIAIRLLYEGKPVAGAQITVYKKTLKQASQRRTFVSNDEGIVHVPQSGNTKYLINAVRLRKTSLLERFVHGAHFNSLWASLTFSTPAI